MPKQIKEGGKYKEPWILWKHGQHIGAYSSVPLENGLDTLLTNTYSSMAVERAVECVNAFSGIANPKLFMEAVLDLEKWLEDCHLMNCPLADYDDSEIEEAKADGSECDCKLSEKLEAIRLARQGKCE